MVPGTTKGESAMAKGFHWGGTLEQDVELLAVLPARASSVDGLFPVTLLPWERGREAVAAALFELAVLYANAGEFVARDTYNRMGCRVQRASPVEFAEMREVAVDGV